jgi:hypothetical protein
LLVHKKDDGAVGEVKKQMQTRFAADAQRLISSCL